MSRCTNYLNLLFGTLLFACLSLSTVGQSRLRALFEKNLPGSAFRGLWWSAGINSSWIFTAKLTADNRLLIYEANTNGEWPLLRISDWWKKQSSTTELKTIGWSSREGKDLQTLDANLQVSSGGTYAVTFAAASWHRPLGDSAPNHETIMTVVDLAQWKVSASIRAAELGFDSLYAERVLDNQILLEGHRRGTPSSIEQYLLVSLVDLRPDSNCSVELPEATQQESGADIQKPIVGQDGDCSQILRASGTTSLEDVNKLIQTGAGSAPGELSHLSRLEDSTLLHGGDGDWYSLDSAHSELAIWTPQGAQKIHRQSGTLLCENQKVIGPAWICGCSIVGESNGRLLTYCLTEHDNFWGSQVWLKQWLSVFDSTDLSEIGFITMSHRNEQTEEAIATIEGHTYVATVALGEKLTVYEIP